MAAGEVMAGPLSEFPAYVMQGKTEVNKKHTERSRAVRRTAG
ncbi:MAG: hypothetical protein ACLT3V_11415 [Lachnospira sp.]